MLRRPILRTLAVVACVTPFLLSATACRRTVSVAAKENSPSGTVQPTRQSTPHRIVRASGTIQAVQTYKVRVPQLSQITGRNSQLTLTTLAPNGTAVRVGDTLVEFDPTTQLDDARDANAKLDDLQHQLEEKRAQVNSDATKRVAGIREAEVDLGKAKLQLQKGPVLADLDRQKNEVKAATARDRLASMNKSHAARLKAEAAAVRILELKCERQKLVVERLKSNIERLSIRAPHDGMVALENVWRSGSMGPPQVGDQMWPNQPVLRIFDPSEMIVDAQVNEPDFAAIGNATNARVFLDAYPNVAFDAQLESASPVATAGLESPVKSFSARFRIMGRDVRLLPDLSASLEIEANQASAPVRSASAAGPASARPIVPGGK